MKLTSPLCFPAALSTEQMLLKDSKSLAGSLNLAVSVLYVPLEVSACGLCSAHGASL